MAANGVALAKLVIHHPPFDEWHINGATHLVLNAIAITVRCLEILLFCGFGPVE
jgi:hypothetical protein